MNNNDQAYNQIFLVVFGLAVMMGLNMLYQSNKELVNGILIVFNLAHLKVLSLIPGKTGETAGLIYVKLAQKNPAAFTINQIMAQATYCGRYFRWPGMVVLTGMSVLVWRMGKADKYCNVYSMKSLLRHNVEVFPCMAPIALRENDLLQEPLDKGPWRTARQPIQWVAENKLLLDENGNPAKLLIAKSGLANLKSPLLKGDNNSKLQLDRDKIRKLLIEQLGDPFTGVDDLPDYQKGLAAAFMAFGHGNKDDAQKLLDQMALSFVEAREAVESRWTFTPPFYRSAGDERPFEIDTDGADALLEKYKDSEDVLYFTENHSAFVHTWFHALLLFAREKGVLSTSQFIWLRPTDRILWYTLNQVGGRTAWTEAAGPWTHYLAEKTLEKTIHDPQVEMGITALVESLQNSGWLPKLVKKKSRKSFG